MRLIESVPVYNVALETVESGTKGTRPNKTWMAGFMRKVNRSNTVRA